jgi:hypothetical protein
MRYVSGGHARGDNLGVTAALLDRQVGSAPNVEVRDHPSFPSYFKNKRRTDAGLRGLSTISGRPTRRFGNGSPLGSVAARSRRNSSMRARIAGKSSAARGRVVIGAPCGG